MATDLSTELQRIGNHALTLLNRQGEPSVESVTLCQRLFETAGEPTLYRWAECELGGYGGSGAVAVGVALGAADDAPLTSKVRAYRQYVGKVRSQAAPGRALQLPYFFGESLETLRHLRANTDAIGVDFIEVELIIAPKNAKVDEFPSGEPLRSLEFPRYIFYRILSGLAVEMEVAVRNILKRA